MATLNHLTLNGRFIGVESEYMYHFRGIPYGTVTQRFTNPVMKSTFDGEEVDCTRYGPRCPQIKLDIGYLLREPEGQIFHSETEDEFACLNLDVAIPKTKRTYKLPVFLWVHGGSQIVSYGNGASKVGDVRKLVQSSVEQGSPMIVVSVQYRLNIFHVGDNPERKNFGLKDLQCAVRWVRDHIYGFGGDPDNITLAGESAGAALVHALIVAGADVRRALLMSGTLWMSPPRPHPMASSAVIEPITLRLHSQGYTLQDAPAAELIRIQSEIPIVSVFLQEAHELADWATSTGKVSILMIGDCEFESAIFRNGIENLSAEQIDVAFSKAGRSAEELKKLYHINPTRPSSCRAGALDLLNDIFWAIPTSKLKAQVEDAGGLVFRYLFDQPNPWQASARAHHAVDLLHLFEGFTISDPGALAVAKELRRRLVLFVAGQPPWPTTRTCAFGSHGNVSEIGRDEVTTRRRVTEMERLAKMPAKDIAAARAGLVVGTLSLHN
ncbi:carboxylesterase [Myriangium duriaei CBS 260.36]|uniref:Carboxylic ester hydrolase n=1 Tax=Myriangium duriaei CBS 260.36 TaxID=1168546 RepID=A0A9P4J602_9PEZI|nr:carboxylesterase [Myriangium duriaei CBS 260.36]